MAASTTLKLPERLKRRIAPLARSVGKTPHGFMVEAIELQTALSERRREVLGDALAAREQVAEYGLVYDGDEVLSYLKARLEGRKPARPSKRKL